MYMFYRLLAVLCGQDARDTKVLEVYQEDCQDVGGGDEVVLPGAASVAPECESHDALKGGVWIERW